MVLPWEAHYGETIQVKIMTTEGHDERHGAKLLPKRQLPYIEVVFEKKKREIISRMKCTI